MSFNEYLKEARAKKAIFEVYKMEKSGSFVRANPEIVGYIFHSSQYVDNLQPREKREILEEHGWGPDAQLGDKVSIKEVKDYLRNKDVVVRD